MKKNGRFGMVILLGLIIFLQILLASKSSGAAAKKVPYNPNAPQLFVHFWDFNPYSNSFRYTSPNGEIVKEINLQFASDADKMFLDELQALPYDHAAILGSIFATGCLSWSKSAHKQAKDWNEKNPHSAIKLHKAKD